MENRYFGQFTNVTDLQEKFKNSTGINDDEILLAIYQEEDYSGSAFVLLKRNGQLLEVEASHCSCNGLEGQWDPAPTAWKAQELRLKDRNGSWLRGWHFAEFKQAFEALVNMATFWEEAETHD